MIKKDKHIFDQAVERLRHNGLDPVINPETNSAVDSFQGKSSIYRFILHLNMVEDTLVSLTMNTVLLSPTIKDLGIDFSRLLDWLNAKNSDIAFGRYYYIDDDILTFELSLPIIDEAWDWPLFDYFLKLALFSFDDAIDQLKAVAER